MSHELIMVHKNNHGIEPGVYLAYLTMVGGEQAYILQTGNDKNRTVHQSVVEHVHPHVFMEEMFKSHREEIQRLQQEVDDLRSPVKMPGEVFDALLEITSHYPDEVGYAKVLEYNHANEVYVSKMRKPLKIVNEWRVHNKEKFRQGIANDFKREMTAKEKWIQDVKEAIQDPDIKTDAFLAAMYDQYNVEQILKEAKKETFE